MQTSKGVQDKFAPAAEALQQQWDEAHSPGSQGLAAVTFAGAPAVSCQQGPEDCGPETRRGGSGMEAETRLSPNTAGPEGNACMVGVGRSDGVQVAVPTSCGRGGSASPGGRGRGRAGGEPTFLREWV